MINHKASGFLLLLALLAACARATPTPVPQDAVTPALLPTLPPPTPTPSPTSALPTPTPTSVPTAISPTAISQLVATMPALPVPFSGKIQIPAPNARVTLPLHVLARVGQPGEQIVAVLTWEDGAQLSQKVTLLPGEDGDGLLIESLDWSTESQPPQPPTQPATLALYRLAGELLARQAVTVLSADDPETQVVTLYWLLGETLMPVQRRIPRAEGIGAAALEELLWGPAPGSNFAGFETALPTPAQVLAYPGRGPDWGPRVTLRLLTIVDGVATADFSREMAAHQGGSTRVALIRQQITQTLLQFSTVREVRITVEGQTDVLEP